MTTAEEEFSFPAATTDMPPCFIDSPPLWQALRVDQEKPQDYKGKEVEDGDKSESCFSHDHDHDDEKEENMDQLWENLNDEFSRKLVENSDITSSPGREVHMKCVKGWKLSKTISQVFSGKQPSILVFIKVLKKVFSMRNSPRPIKKRAW